MSESESVTGVSMKIFPIMILAATITLPVMDKQLQANADEVLVPVTEQGDKSIQVPRNSLTKDEVREQFGEPEKEAEPVGTPAITKWEYPGFTVYFENDRVIHSVLKKQG